jgi:hypothetical protein
MSDLNQELKRIGAELLTVAEDWMEDPPTPGMAVSPIAVSVGIAMLREFADEAEVLILRPMGERKQAR